MLNLQTVKTLLLTDVKDLFKTTKTQPTKIQVQPKAQTETNYPETISKLNNLQTLLIKQTIKALGKASKASDNTILFVTHYALGSQEDLTLPESLLDRSRQAVKASLQKQMVSLQKKEIKTWIDSLTAEIFYDTFDDPDLDDDSWWWTNEGASTVGKFNFKVTFNYETEQVHIQCQDHWDFNVDATDILEVTVPKALGKTASSLLNMFNIEHTYSFDKIKIKESVLTKFNKEHSFYTRWEHVLDFSELTGEYYEYKTNCHDYISKGSYILRVK